jgi:hypothetical protein
MVVAQVNGLQLLPDTSEAVAGVVSVLILVAIILVVIGAIAWFKRAAERRRELVVRVGRLEERGGQDTNP